ncbi:glycerol-3-phosphate dehydrogenase/oxidase [Schlesneria sp. T3-172]|uniref:glycerol-3-phosphate dehydrogenase/oxidase n=1 Tax=Schlesneria sphaerica TaxID=3373610 RepID=UPI0037C94606
MKREQMRERLESRRTPWDMLIIGGGATGVGVAVDAASRGYEVLLLEQHDFGKGTSSRSTKLVHGGVRYLEQGNISLVMEALKERGLLRQNAPHLVHDLAFIVPSYTWWESPFYGFGLKVYNLLSGRYRFGPTSRLSRDEILKRLPTIKTEGLQGGVVYYDGQFDDARLLINLATTASERGAVLLNYMEVTKLRRDVDGFISGVVARDRETDHQLEIAARVVINATGAYCDAVRKMADPAASTLIAPSQGIHLVFDRSFLPGNSAIMVPHTPDGRVMFAIPWHQHTLVGTTDVPLNDIPIEPVATEEEIDFILETAGRYLSKPPRRSDILSVFAGIRPLVRTGDGTNTAALSRDHTIHIDHSGLLTIAGGKWTTYRNMAEDCVDQAATLAQLPERHCLTRTLAVHGAASSASVTSHLAVYGSDAVRIEDIASANPELRDRLDPALPYIGAEVIFAVRHEMARTVEDVLARRTRSLFLNAKAAVEMAPRVARLMARELPRDQAWIADQIAQFEQTAASYRVSTNV